MAVNSSMQFQSSMRIQVARLHCFLFLTKLDSIVVTHTNIVEGDSVYVDFGDVDDRS